MRVLVAFLLVLPAVQGGGQIKENIESLVSAERLFAKTAREKTTRQAFLTFLADSGLVFQPRPVNGKQFWSKAEEGQELLSWKPAYVFLSSSGELGYSTGPWEFLPDRTDSIAAANGYFVSVWKKINREWKVLLDIGISFPLTTRKETELFETGLSAGRVASSPAAIKGELLDIENEFIAEYARTGNASWPSYVSGQARFYREGSFPYVDDESRESLFTDTSQKLTYQIIDGGASSAGDLGYVYGNIAIESKTSTGASQVNGSYLRVWKKENGNWKIALDLIHVGR